MAPAAPRHGSAPTLKMALLLATLSMVSPLSIDSFYPSIPAIAGEFGLSAWQVQQVITAYMLPFATLTLVHGPLSDALGRRRMVTPVTPPERLKKICASAQGFVYAVTMTGVTGKALGADAVDPVVAAGEYLDRVRAVSPVPVCAGFGIRQASQVQALGPHTDGVIVGSAIVETLERGESAAALLKSLRGGA